MSLFRFSGESIILHECEILCSPLHYQYFHVNHLTVFVHISATQTACLSIVRPTLSSPAKAFGSGLVPHPVF